MLDEEAKGVYKLELIYTPQKMEPHNLIQRSADHDNLSLNSEYFDRFLEKWLYVEEKSVPSVF